ncbi:MAG TPA: bifunctional enoyl-CoA hydratase/phosphate acetyltransferase [Gammaproteobacteria bacterium]
MLSTQPFEIPAAQMSRAARVARKSAAVAGADSEVALLSARRAAEEGLIRPVLVGDESRIRSLSEKISWDIGDVEVIGCSDETETSVKSVALARTGEVEILIKGSVHTDALMRAAVDRENGLRSDRRMSHVFQMTFPDHGRALYITDASLNVAPSVDLSVQITCNAVDLLHRLGMTSPKVAVLSAVEVATPSVPSSMNAAEIARRATAGEVENAIVEGPLSLDLAVSPDAASVKGLKSRVAGQADLLVVPNIETGNALFKALVYFRSATAAGLVLGASVPIVLTSRADPPEARLAAVALAMMM